MTTHRTPRETVAGANRCPNCQQPVDNGKHPKVQGGHVRRMLCRETEAVMWAEGAEWHIEEPPTSDADVPKRRPHVWPNRASRRR